MAEHPGQSESVDRDEQRTRSEFPWSSALLGSGLAVSLGLGVWQQSSLMETKMRLAGVQSEVLSLRQAVNSADGSAAERVAMLRQEMDAARKETSETAQAARAAAMNAASRQAKLLAERFNEQQRAQSEQLEAKLNEIKQNADQASAKLTDITAEVGTVKTEVSSTRSEVEKIASDLRRSVGDLGVMSGLIATNSKELQALRELGERDYVEFTLAKSKKLERVGDVQLKLKKADQKRNRYSLEVVADDKRVEKKDRNVNEPVQFYVVSKARQPYELVVNEVTKDRVKGYLAVPKIRLTARM